MGRGSFGRSKAFDRINRIRLRLVLYEKGLPIKIINGIIKGHGNNLLQGNHNGTRGRKVNNNKGVFQGSPISALLYIIFAGGIMDGYEKELLKLKTKMPDGNKEHGSGI